MEESGERPRSCDAIASVLTGGGLPPCSFEPRRGHMPPSAQQELRRALAALLLPTLAVGSRCSMRRTQTISIEAPQFAEITWRAHKSTNKFKLAKLAKSHNKYYYRILYPLSTCYAHAPTLGLKARQSTCGALSPVTTPPLPERYASREMCALTSRAGERTCTAPVPCSLAAPPYSAASPPSAASDQTARGTPPPACARTYSHQPARPGRA